MVKAIVISVVMLFVGSAFAESAGDDWFAAAFTGFGDEDRSSVNGGWHKSGCAEGEMCGDGLYVDGSEEPEFVEFEAFYGRNAEYGAQDWIIESRVDFGSGFDELPPVPPAEQRVRAAVAPVDGGNYFVLGFDDRGRTNVWLDTGMPFAADGEVEVKVEFSFTNRQDSAVYRLGGCSTGPVRISSASVRRVAFSGAGCVTSLCGGSAAVSEMVRVKLPCIPGLDVYQPGDVEYAYPGERISVCFSAREGEPSRSSAEYTVLPDGMLELADGGEPPYSVEVAVQSVGERFRNGTGTAVASSGNSGSAVLSPAGFRQCVPFEISDYEGPEVLDFPVLVRISDAKVPGVYGVVMHAGADLRFTDVTGTVEYPYEVDVWNPEGESLLWVRIPVLGNGRRFRMYYGNPGRTVNAGAERVWTDYHGVWHFNPGLRDSGAGHYDGTDFGTAGATSGAIGTGWTVSASDKPGDRVGAVACLGSGGLRHGGTFTWSGWIRTAVAGHGEYMCAIAKRPLACWKAGFSDGGFSFIWNCERDSGGCGFFSSGGHGRGMVGCRDARPLNDGSWRHVAIAAENGVLRAYLDGAPVSVSETPPGGFTDNDYPLVFGNESSCDFTGIGTARLPADSSSGTGCRGPGSAWKGSLDEFRLHREARRAEDVAAEYQVSVKDVTVFGRAFGVPAVEARFSAESTDGEAPFRTVFTANPDERLVGGVTYRWDFDGDGVFDAETTVPESAGVYGKRGTYSVRLQAEDAEGRIAEGWVDGYIRVRGNVYVDATAVEGGDGSKGHPFRTVRDGLAAASAGETVLVRGGVARKYAIDDCGESWVLSVAGMKLVGCDEEWHPAAGYADMNAMAAVVVADGYAERSGTLSGSRIWPAPIVVAGKGCAVSGILGTFGACSLGQEGTGCRGFVEIAASGVTVENCCFLMKDPSCVYGGSCTRGVISASPLESTEDLRRDACVIRNCRFRTGSGGGTCLFCDLHDRTQVEGCLVENAGTLFRGACNIDADVGYTVVSNLFLNCGGRLFSDGGNFVPRSCEIAYNIAVRDDGAKPEGCFLRRNCGWGGNLSGAVVIHHNTILGYDRILDAGDGGAWRPLVFDNLAAGAGTGFSEPSAGLFRSNVLLADWPVFARPSDPGSRDGYRLDAERYPWVIGDAWDGREVGFPGGRFIGAVRPISRGTVFFLR